MSQKPQLVLSIKSEDDETEQLDFWCLPAKGNTQFNLGLKCTGPLTQENVLEALQYFIDQVIDDGIDLLNFGLSQTKH